MSPLSDQRYLLLIACTASKRADIGLLPALERYTGPSFRVLRHWLRNPAHCTHQLDVLVLSAEFGLIPASRPIPDYNRRMTAARAQELRPQVQHMLQQVLTNASYSHIYVSAGKTYRAMLGDLSKLSIETAPEGSGIGYQLTALKG